MPTGGMMKERRYRESGVAEVRWAVVCNGSGRRAVGGFVRGWVCRVGGRGKGRRRYVRWRTSSPTSREKRSLQQQKRRWNGASSGATMARVALGRE